MLKPAHEPATPEPADAVRDMIERLAAIVQAGDMTATPRHLALLQSHLDGYQAGYNAGYQTGWDERAAAYYQAGRNDNAADRRGEEF